MKYECQCKLGFHGDGLRCAPGENVGCNIVNDCHQNGTCVVDPHNLRYHCRCNGGFEGDGKTCRQYQSCMLINTCDVKAECIYDNQLENYKCQCLTGGQRYKATVAY